MPKSMSCVIDMGHTGKRDSIRMLYCVKGDGRRLTSNLSGSIKDMRNTVIKTGIVHRKVAMSFYLITL